MCAIGKLKNMKPCTHQVQSSNVCLWVSVGAGFDTVAYSSGANIAVNINDNTQYYHMDIVVVYLAQSKIRLTNV